MAKIKLRDLSIIMFVLVAILGYQNFKIRNYDKILAAAEIRKAKMNELQKNANKFLKTKKKIFQKNKNLKRNISEIFKEFSITSVLFKEISPEKFKLKFEINNEQNFYILLNKLRTDLCGIISFDEIKIKNLKKFLQVSLSFRVFYPPADLQKYFHINKCDANKAEAAEIDNEEFTEIFDLQKIKNYQLNGILHYDTAYINGKPFHEGDSVGGYQISKIYDEFIIIKNRKKSVKIKIDEAW